MPVNDYTQSPISWMPDRKDIKYPQYLSLAALLVRDIESGVLPPGTKLPSQRELADYLDLNFTTVTRAYDLCRDRQLIYGIIGRGTYVSPRSSAKTSSDLIELGVVLGFPSECKEVIDAARRVVSKTSVGMLFNYNERMGFAHQREAGVQWMRRFGVHSSVENTAIFAGAQNAITTALLSLFKFGDAIAVDRFTYANLIGAARLAHLKLVPVADDEDGMQSDALDDVCRTKRVTGIFLMPSCANPTTITMSEKRRDAISEICARYALTIIEDDASIVQNNHRTIYDRLPEQTFYIAATTRHLVPGLRITFACFPEQFRQPLMQGLFLTSIKASALDAEIISELVSSGSAETLLFHKYKLAVQANHIFNRVFPNAGKFTEGAFFRMLPLQYPVNGPDFEQRAVTHKIRVCHSYRFSVEPNPATAFLRVSLSSTFGFEQLERGLLILKELIESEFAFE